MSVWSTSCKKSCAYLSASKLDQGIYALGKIIAEVKVLKMRSDCQRMSCLTEQPTRLKPHWINTEIQGLISLLNYLHGFLRCSQIDEDMTRESGVWTLLFIQSYSMYFLYIICMVLYMCLLRNYCRNCQHLFSWCCLLFGGFTWWCFFHVYRLSLTQNEKLCIYQINIKKKKSSIVSQNEFVLKYL